ncbi:MAG: PmoA family protein [Clostridia bacterium]|nr:PmoA family protein [Clostridia bacterium]
MNTLQYTSPVTLKQEPTFIACEACDCIRGLAAEDGRVFPAQKAEGGIIAILTCEAGETLTLNPVKTYGSECAILKEENSLKVQIAGHDIGGYVWDTAYWKPYFGPVTDDAGNHFTRLDFDTLEHPHHRSVFIAVGDVNGVDAWNEPEDCGIVRTEEIKDIKAGSAYASFTAVNRWMDHSEKPLVKETTTYTMYNQTEDCRMLDIDVLFTAEYGEVNFGPTKEAGPLGVRMRDELRADRGTGVIINSRGEVAEKECWGHEAEWCDYAGDMPFGKMGVTVFDHPGNERFPTAWHVRNYGLFAANNLFFKGDLTIKEGDSLRYRFRILFRRCEMSVEEIRTRFDRFAHSEQ